MQYSIQKLTYVFPHMPDFREDRPRLCWEYIYGWMDGYGILFDPAVLSLTGLIPEWENGWDRSAALGEFVITCSAEASAAVDPEAGPGIYIRPGAGFPTSVRGAISQKERLETPAARLFYPCRLPYDGYEAPASTGWSLAQRGVVQARDGRLAVGFELFGMLSPLRMAEWPQRRLMVGADLVRELLVESGAWKGAEPPAPLPPEPDLRLDFQAYGLSRLFLQWLIRRRDGNPAMVQTADRYCQEALAAWQRGNAAEVRTALTAAFEQQRRLREAQSRLTVRFLEYPHLGLLPGEQGFFELEWPEYSRALIEAHVALAKDRYAVALEAGAGCWKNLTARYPELKRQLIAAWGDGRIELTNGTYSLPYALYSPLSLQFLQFQEGQKTFRETFGRVPETYQCQENSFSPQMPELLRYFGYRRAVHVTQNHGQTPAAEGDVIQWQSPAGYGLPALATVCPAWAKKGNNYYLDLPILHAEHGTDPQPFNYFCMMDLAFPPFRVQMVRVHCYAPVWGEYVLADKLTAGESALQAARVCRYGADDYNVSATTFYYDFTGINSLSTYERVFRSVHRLRRNQLAAYVAGQTKTFQAHGAAAVPLLCLMEAHDATIVPGQRIGEFYAPGMAQEASPYGRQTLADRMNQVETEFQERMTAAEESLCRGDQPGLLNASEVILPFGRVAGALAKPADGAEAFCLGHYAAGPFDPWAWSTRAQGDEDPQALTLPLRAGPWRLVIEAEGFRLSRQDQMVTLVPVDGRRGEYSLRTSSAQRRGGLYILELIYDLKADPLQTMAVSLVLTEESNFAEMAVRYVPGRAFSFAGRWDDYVALRVIGPSRVAKVWRFNPNVRTETREDRVVSPYFLGLDLVDGGALSLMNEGAFFYRVDRKAGWAEWLVHVAGESVHQRRMGLVFGTSMAFPLARAWSQGLLPSDRPVRSLPAALSNPGCVSLELMVDERQLLISNLTAQCQRWRWAASAVIEVRNLSGKSCVAVRAGDELEIELRPFELALAELGEGLRNSFQP